MRGDVQKPLVIFDFSHAANDADSALHLKVALNSVRRARGASANGIDAKSMPRGITANCCAPDAKVLVNFLALLTADNYDAIGRVCEQPLHRQKQAGLVRTVIAVKHVAVIGVHEGQGRAVRSNVAGVIQR